jgi:surface protein
VFFRLFFLRVDCECNRPSFLATVFSKASAFNGDLNQWDVAEVTDMTASKSTRIVENDYAIVIEGFSRGFGVGGDDVM